MSTENFHRSDIVPGYIVEFRNGERRFVTIVNEGTYVFVNPNNHTWDYRSSWEKELTYHTVDKTGRPVTESPKDIMVVYGLVSKTRSYGCAMDINDVDDRPVIWQRTVAKKMTVAEIEAALGHAVEIVAEGE